MIERDSLLLFVLDGKNVGQRAIFDSDEVVVGRSPGDTDFRIAEEFVSRHHFVIRYEENHFRLDDLGSTNGTLVNDHKVTTAILEDGAVITLCGTHEFSLVTIVCRLGARNTLERRAREIGQEQRYLDRLTGAFRHDLLPDRLHRTFGELLHPFRILVVEIEQFAHFNKNHGTYIGNYLLKKLFLTLVRAHGEHTVWIARKGDEFFLLEFDTTSPLGEQDDLATERTAYRPRPWPGLPLADLLPAKLELQVLDRQYSINLRQAVFSFPEQESLLNAHYPAAHSLRELLSNALNEAENLLFIHDRVTGLEQPERLLARLEPQLPERFSVFEVVYEVVEQLNQKDPRFGDHALHELAGLLCRYLQEHEIPAKVSRLGKRFFVIHEQGIVTEEHFEHLRNWITDYKPQGIGMRAKVLRKKDLYARENPLSVLLEVFDAETLVIQRTVIAQT
ncbi:MAG: hypothetical protein A2284_14270 [Deltaproteobacteria bacterium RIFOXYA12_FULL_61_11]|nr:MAG: hypothetical protein A2284_14270 [Deltaproteobacteria bacterium RIFOXYA12_FULL_61_11]